jgi:RNA polymerase sigma-70 factor (ECF subfamily)
MLVSVKSLSDRDEDREFILALYEKYNKLIYRKIQDRVGTTHEIEDLVNDTLIKLIEKIETLKSLEERELLYYIVKASNHTASDFIKRCSVQQKHIYYGNANDLRDNISELKDESYTYNERLEDLAKAILKLPERDSGLLIDKYFFHKTDRELAASIGIKENSVREYLTRARRRARALMEKGRQENGQ